jgi:hypothetical protein
VVRRVGPDPRTDDRGRARGTTGPRLLPGDVSTRDATLNLCHCTGGRLNGLARPFDG